MRNDELRLGIILGSTRPGRIGEQVASWVQTCARGRTDGRFELIDLRDVELPLFDERVPPSLGRYHHDHTRRWAERVAGFDGFVVVTPEYNHSMPAVLKNAFDFLYAEWNNKAIGFVSYGSTGGVRAVEQLRLVAGELQLADVRTQVALNFSTDFADGTQLQPPDRQVEVLHAMLDQLVAWSGALAELRRRTEAEREAGYRSARG